MKKVTLFLLLYLAVYGAVVLVVYPHLPPIVPSHWTSSTTPDGHAPKFQMVLVWLSAILLVPVIIYPLVLGLKRFSREPFPEKLVQRSMIIISGILTLESVFYFMYLIHPNWLEPAIIFSLIVAVVLIVKFGRSVT
jgi:hypothetical protein